jgi:uncharacterized protein YjiS (DUF1127 family)
MARTLAGTTTLGQARPSSVEPNLGQAGGRLLELVLRGYDTWRQRRILQTLDQRMLHDIGISAADVEHEVRRPFWDLPQV